MAVLDFFHGFHAACGADIRACKFHMQFLKLLYLDLNRVNAVQLQRGIQHNTAAFVAVRRGIGPAAAPVDADRQFHRHLILRYPIILAGGQLGRRIVINRPLDGSEAHGFQGIIACLAEGDPVFLHVLCQSVIDTDFQGKSGFPGILQQHFIDILADTMGSEYLQRFFIIGACFNGPYEFAGKDPAFQLMLPFADGKDIRSVKAGIQAHALLIFPGFYLFRGSGMLRHFFYNKSRTDRFLHRISRRVKGGKPEIMLSILPQRFGCQAVARKEG